MNDDRQNGGVGTKIMLWLAVFLAGALLLGGLIASTTSSIPNNANTNTANQEDTKKQENGFSGVKNETTTEVIRYSSSTIKDAELDEGKTEIRTIGVNGSKTITYKVTYENDKEISREKVSEEITKQPINEVKAVGTKHTYTGSCSVKGTYRNRYVSCSGDYSPQAKINAENKARECNTNSRAVQGCYNTYR